MEREELFAFIKKSIEAGKAAGELPADCSVGLGDDTDVTEEPEFIYVHCTTYDPSTIVFRWATETGDGEIAFWRVDGKWSCDAEDCNKDFIQKAITYWLRTNVEKTT